MSSVKRTFYLFRFRLIAQFLLALLLLFSLFYFYIDPVSELYSILLTDASITLDADEGNQVIESLVWNCANKKMQSSLTSQWPIPYHESGLPISTVFPRHPGESGPIHVELKNLKLNPKFHYFGAWQYIDNIMEYDHYENGILSAAELAPCSCDRHFHSRIQPQNRTATSLSFVSESSLFPSKEGRYRFCLIRGHLEWSSHDKPFHKREKECLFRVDEMSSHVHIVHHRSRGIHAVYSYYVSKNPKRHFELMHTLRLNLDASSILERVYLIRANIEDEVPEEFVKHPKVRIYDTYAKGRPVSLFEDRYLLQAPAPTERTTFAQLHHFMIYALDGYRAMWSNFDIRVDETLNAFQSISDLSFRLRAFGIAPHDFDDNTLNTIGMETDPYLWYQGRPLSNLRCRQSFGLGSFDVALMMPHFHALSLSKVIPELHYETGVFGCENRYFYEYRRATEFTLFNRTEPSSPLTHLRDIHQSLPPLYFNETFEHLFEFKNPCYVVRIVHVHNEKSPNSHPGERVNTEGRSYHELAPLDSLY